MIVTILFLISCVMTARLLDKKKMHMASAAYSVLFVILLAALLLTSDLEVISRSLSNLMGAKVYLQTKDALVYAIRSAGYGFCILIALFLTLFLQISLSLICAVVAIVKFFKKGREALVSVKDKYRFTYIPRSLYIRKQINLLYCRMLN